MNTNKTKDQEKKNQSLKKDNEHDNKREDIIDIENLSKNIRSENNSSFYEEFYSINKDVKNQDINKQFANSKKSTNLTEGKKSIKKNNNVKNIIMTTLNYDANQKMFIEKEKKYINLEEETNKKSCLNKKTKLDEESNDKNNLDNINVNKNLNKNVNNKNHTIKNKESKNNVKNDEYQNNANMEINEDLIEELSKLDNEGENIFYEDVNRLIDNELIQENYENECISKIVEPEISSIICNQSPYQNNNIREQDMQSMQDMLAIGIHHNTFDSSTNDISHNYNNYLNS